MVKRTRRTTDWPKRPLYWFEGGHEFISIPFTWNLPAVREKILHASLLACLPRMPGYRCLCPSDFSSLPAISRVYRRKGHR